MRGIMSNESGKQAIDFRLRRVLPSAVSARSIMALGATAYQIARRVIRLTPADPPA